jgi:ribosomal-protein-alanine acetyltransferase
MPFKIEVAALEDLDVLQKIEKECFSHEAFTREHLALLLEKPSAVSLTAKIDHKIVGFIIGVVETHGKVRMGHVFTIDVDTEHRRTGVGLKLLGELERILLEKGVDAVYLEVRVDNKAAIELYRKKGYTETQPLENYYSKGAHGFRMKKELKTKVRQSQKE